MRGREDGPTRVRETATPDPAAAAFRGQGPLALDVLTPGALLRLQRTLGNAAVARMVEAGRAARVSIQREDETSEEMLTRLAVPRIGEGPSIAVQMALVTRLEELIAMIPSDDRLLYGATEYNLGGILIDSLPKLKDDKKRQFAQVEKKARFVALPTRKSASSGAIFSPAVLKDDLGPLVMENTLRTMIDAEQVKYLQLAGLPNAEWKILVEVMYMRARPKDMAGFHKDTRGQSIFVNLNYHVDKHKLRGPEYILNPDKIDEHDELIFGDGDERKGTLPDQVGRDIRATRKALAPPDEIMSSGTVNPYGYVAFVDEAVHHATPWFGGRYITPQELEDYLGRTHPKELAEIKRTGGRTKGLDTEIIDKHDVKKWQTWHKMISVAQSDTEKRKKSVRYTRADFAKTMMPGEFDRVLVDVGSQPGAARDSAGAGGWVSASMANPGKDESLLGPVQDDSVRPPLRRQASNPKLTKKMPKQLPDEVPRRFIRTWVRAVPEVEAAQLRGG